MTKFQGYIPVYLADRTIVGYAEVEVQGEKTLINMELSSNGHIAELVKENLVGFSIMYMDRNRVEEVQNNQGEEADGRQEAVDRRLHDSSGQDPMA